MSSGRVRRVSAWLLRTALLAAACVVTAVVLRAQHEHGQAALPEGFNQPMPLYPAPQVLGTFTRPVSSLNPGAQRFFDQGFQLMYAFDKYGLSARSAKRKSSRRIARSAIGVKRGRGARS